MFSSVPTSGPPEQNAESSPSADEAEKSEPAESKSRRAAPREEYDGPENNAVGDVYQQVRMRMRTWLRNLAPGARYADILLVAPDLFHLLCKLVVDSRIPPLQKAKLAATIAYFVTPVGIVPEALTGPIGYIDDVALAAYVLNGMLNSDQAHVVREHWAGDKDVLNVVQGVLEVVDSAISHGLWSKLKNVRLGHRRR